MPRKNGIDDLRHNRIVVSDDAGENRAALTQLHDQVIAHLVLHAPGTQPFFRKGLWRNSPRVRGRLMKKPPKKETASDPDYTPFENFKKFDGKIKISATWPLPPAFCRTCTVRRMLGKIASK